ncbi:MAG: D-aminoacyl-tRNA deacylase [Balneolaceae bacterium]|nr:D-aminoacyl-tRNA deacylase [Balneolaceae bacterium]
MKIVIQRVSSASVRSESEKLGVIGRGLLLLVGIRKGDKREDVEWCCEKIRKMRIFDDPEGRMNLSVEDVEGELLIVSQFTIYGDPSRGNRPSYSEAADPGHAEELYDYMLHYLENNFAGPVAAGRFGSYMEVDLSNDGPVTLILDR